MRSSDSKDEIVEFLVGIHNEVYFELGVLPGTNLSITNIRNIFKRQPPQELQERLVRLPYY